MIARAGVAVPLVTPLDEHGAVCADSVARLIATLAPNVTALVPALSTGEGWLLDDRQWQDMLDATLRHRHGLPVFVGVQSANVRTLLARVRLAAERGADAVVVGPPMEPDCDQDDVYQHYRSIRSASPVPLLLYNEAALGAGLMSVSTIVRVCSIGGVVGIKDSSGQPAVTATIMAALPGLPVFQGWENLLTATPATGFIGPLANLEPAVCAAALTERSAERQEQVDRLVGRFGIFDSDWYFPVKRELVARGVLRTARTVRPGAVAGTAGGGT